MNVSGRTTVSKLKTMFREEFGIGVRVYSGNRFAEDTATLASIRNGGDAKKSDFELRGNMKVGNAEKLFKDVFGITIQIEDSAGKLADNRVTIASLKTAKNAKADKAAAPKSAPKGDAPEINEGDCVEFGSYYQENSSEKTPIEWLALKKSGSKVLLISWYGLDCKQYHHENADVTWENSDLRKWLNGEFMNNAFTGADQKKIAVTKLENNNNARYDTFGGSSTEDRVFCLSLSEAENLFRDDSARQCMPTRYAASKGVRQESVDGADCCWWWLRTPGMEEDIASCVRMTGALSPLGNGVSNGHGTVRPALWVNQDGLKAVNPAAKPEVVNTADKAAPKTAVSELKEGEYFKFGSYYQENSDEKTPIEWLVLKKSGAKALLISRYALDCEPNNDELNMTWENCSLRKWLNGEFLETAFTAEEQGRIEVTKLENDDNAEFGTSGGNSTEDRIFCLSLAEAESLFKDDAARKCVSTPYAAGEGVRPSSRDFLNGRPCCVWCLRSPGSYQSYASDVGTRGVLCPGGSHTFDGRAVRPALWVNQDGSKAVKPAAKPKIVKTADKVTALKAAPKVTPKAAVPELNKAEYFKFGSYYQENSSEKTPIEWLVLKKTDARALLISRYALDCQQYHHESVDMTWENCDLRKWLNGDFLRNAFTAAEQKKIAVTKLANDNNPECGTFGGNSTEDRTFCLSLAEAENLFNDEAARKCVPTPYAVGKGAWQSSSELIDGRACCGWWLRSPGLSRSSALYVRVDGTLGPYDSLGISARSAAVRPALWVNL